MFEASAKKKVMSLSLEERENLARELLASVEAEKAARRAKRKALLRRKNKPRRTTKK